MRIEHPDIVRSLFDGGVDWESEPTLCPICRKECGYFYVSRLDGEIAGCNECLTEERAEDLMEK